MMQLQTSKAGLKPLRQGLCPRTAAAVRPRTAPIVAVGRPAGGGSRMPLGGSGASPERAPKSEGNGAPAPAPAPAAAAPAGPQAVTLTGPAPIQAVLTPAQIYEAIANLGAAKAAAPFWKTMLLGVVAGCYVALGAALLLTVGPNCMGIAAQNPGLAKYITGAIGFPYALLAILVCGSELFTGNTAVLTTAVYEGKATLKQLAKSWSASYLGNIIGCAIGVAMLLNCGLVPLFQNGIAAISLPKVSYPLSQTFLKAIMANWFVCLAVWQCTAAQTMGGKFIACLGPVSAFVCIGLEHCIANLVFVPLGILTGVPGVTWEAFIFKNLIPVTIGNIVAGTLCVATVYAFCYGKPGKKLGA